MWNRTGDELCWAELKNRVLAARRLDGGAPFAFEQRGGRLFLRGLSALPPDALAEVYVLDVEDEPGPLAEQTTFWIPGAHD